MKYKVQRLNKDTKHAIAPTLSWSISEVDATGKFIRVVAWTAKESDARVVAKALGIKKLPPLKETLDALKRFVKVPADAQALIHKIAEGLKCSTSIETLTATTTARSKASSESVARKPKRNPTPSTRSTASSTKSRRPKATTPASTSPVSSSAQARSPRKNSPRSKPTGVQA